jgi:hypothetical protein
MSPSLATKGCKKVIVRIQHLIPMVDSGASRPLKSAEAFTLRAVRSALKSTRHAVTVVLLADEGADRHERAGFGPTRNVLTSVLAPSDGGGPARKLPMLKDILGQVDTTCDVIIFTNPDISVQANFYEQVGTLAEEGFAGSITRRTVKGNPGVRLPLFFGRWQRGQAHPGHDCFFFPSHITSNLVAGNVFLGTPPLGQVMLLNIAVLHPQTEIFSTQNATFHFGDDRPWRESKTLPLRKMNTLAAEAVMLELVAKHGYEWVEAHANRLGIKAFTPKKEGA